MLRLPSFIYLQPKTLAEALRMKAAAGPDGAYVAKEVGQGPLLPVMPAVANAVHDAVGVRVDEVQITPEKVLKALRRKQKGEKPRAGPAQFPDLPWPEPTRVPPPWEGGDGKSIDQASTLAGGVGEERH